MNAPGLRCLLLCVLLLPGMMAWGQPPSPHFRDTVLPTPPQQHAPWVAPKSALPASFVSSVAILFAQGLADPRGCAYRTIEVSTGSCWEGDAGVVKTHGWVLPAAEGAAEQYAVCWNGLVYPVVTVGDAADARADGLAMARAEDERRAAYQRDYPQSTYRHWHDAFTEQHAVSAEEILPLKAVLLFRLGEEAAASKVWQSWQAGEDSNREKPGSDPYLALAGDWTWALFDRTVCAHMRGDDHLALAGARLLTTICPLIDTEVKKRGIDARSYGSAHPVSPSLPFLDQLPDLLADQERRAKAPHAPDMLPITPQRYPDTARRVAALIDQFDDIQAGQMGQPGGVYLANEITVQLVKEGDAAVEPLLHCLESDTRLSRSVHFWRDFARSRHVLGVQEAAYNALTEILHTQFFGTNVTGDDLTSHGLEGRRQVAASIRRYRKRFGSIPLAERWYLTLKDDAAPPAQWIQAADNIACPTDVTMDGGWISMPSSRKPGEVPALRGEVLRKKTNPSVTELLNKRAHELLKPDSDPSPAGNLAKALAAWDPKGSSADLHALTVALIARSGEQTQQSMGYVLGELFEARELYGDPGTLSDYAAWMRGLTPKVVVEASPEKIFQLLWRHADHPEIARAADRLFTDPKSPFVPLLCNRPNVSFSWSLSELIDSPLLGLAPFRTLVLQGLDDTRRAGEVKVSPSGDRLDFQSDFNWSSGAGDATGDPLKPPAGATIVVRTCDLYAWYISRVIGAPRCELYWPLENRAAAVAAAADFLRRYGSHFRYAYGGVDRRGYQEENKAVFHFTPLTHPATAEEVRQGLAFFSLPDPGARMVTLPKYPMPATWVTDQRFPWKSVSVDRTTGKRTEVTYYDQAGLVWQAEEVQVHGQWQRYYGFLGRGGIVRVPAEEIDFPGDWHWHALSAGVEGEIALTGKDGNQGPFTPDEPLTVTVALRNARGIANPVPARLDAPALAATLVLLQQDPKQRENPPTELATLRASVLPPPATGAASPTLPPGEERPLATFPLDRFRAKLPPGNYLLELRATGTQVKGKISVSFEVKQPAKEKGGK